MHFQKILFRPLLIGLFLITINLEASIAADCSFNSADYLQEISNLKNIQTIEIIIKKNKKWTKNLMKAALSDGSILPEYKKKFDAQIKTYYEFGSCSHKGRVRLHGDWKDHIDFLEGGNFIQSLDVSLTNGSIANFVKFKLLLPETRNGRNEIILTHLLRYLNFLAPKTSFVDVSVNGVKTNMLIQEKDEKELLEQMNFKEGPLFEGDETFLFNNYRNFQHLDLIDFSLSKMTNQQWANSSYESALISLKAFSTLQNVYLNYVTSYKENRFALDWGLLAAFNENNISKWAHYEILLFASQASHALIPHNRKFYYNVYNSSFEPIYWDGEPRSLTGEWIRIKPDYRFYPYLKESHFNEIIDMLSNIDIAEFVNSVDQEGIFSLSEGNKTLKDISSKIKILRNEFLIFKKNNHNEYIKQNLNQSQVLRDNLRLQLPDSIIFDIREDKHQKFSTLECPVLQNSCRKKSIGFKEVGTLLETKSLNHDHSKPAILLLPQIKSDSISFQRKVFLNNRIQLEASRDVTITFDENSRNLEIKLGSNNSWVLVHDSHLEDININIFSFDGVSNLSDVATSRINSRGLSGCISFYNSRFQRVNLDVVNFKNACEDTINILNAYGNFSKINISGAFSDALDIDFSAISIDVLSVSNAGNDCVDFSKGKYILGNVFLSNCGDKAISIGEQSYLQATNLKINNAEIGIASKDSSVSKITTSALQNIRVCLEAFQKKQEFSGSLVYLGDFECNSKIIYTDHNSKIFYNEF